VEEDGLPPNVWRGQRRESLGLLGSHTIWVQPCDDQDPILNEHNLNLVTRVALEHGYRVSYQLHKLLGVD
jgi:organic radical activating enzyme